MTSTVILTDIQIENWSHRLQAPLTNHFLNHISEVFSPTHLQVPVTSSEACADQLLLPGLDAWSFPVWNLWNSTTVSGALGMLAAPWYLPWCVYLSVLIFVTFIPLLLLSFLLSWAVWLDRHLCPIPFSRCHYCSVIPFQLKLMLSSITVVIITIITVTLHHFSQSWKRETQPEDTSTC